MARFNSVIHSLLIPIHHDYLVLPNSAVAEVVFFSAIESLESMPDWLLGLLPWRDLSVPVISFEAAVNADEASKSHHRHKYAIIKALGVDPGLRYFAIRAEGIPRLVHIDKLAITPVPEAVEASPFVAKHVFVKDTEAIIPNLDFIEAEIQHALQATV